MPKRFVTRPSSRREQRPTASWLVLGTTTAGQVARNERHTHLTLVKPNDHRRRYHEGLRLQVKGFVGGPTAARVTVCFAERMKLGWVDHKLARDLGYFRLDKFQTEWVANNDQVWAAKLTDPEDLGCYPRAHWPELTHARRFNRWRDREAWLIRFELDTSAEPHLLASRSEELYVTSQARALADEMPALRPEEWAEHIGPAAEQRRLDHLAERRREREALPDSTRADRARAEARAKGYDVVSEFRRYERFLASDRPAAATKQLAEIERRVFPESVAA